jgi:hypothetical protein
MQNKLWINTQAYNYTMNLTLPYFTQQYTVQNYKNSNTKVFIYKYLHLLIL